MVCKWATTLQSEKLAKRRFELGTPPPTKFIGVTLTEKNKWKARIYREKIIHLGNYPGAAFAAGTYDEAAKKWGIRWELALVVFLGLLMLHHCKLTRGRALSGARSGSARSGARKGNYSAFIL